MTWDWSSPIAIGIFIVLACLGIVLLATAGAIASGRAKVSEFKLWPW